MKLTMNLKFIIAAMLGLMLTLSTNIKAQYDLGLYSMRLVPQTNLMNPAFIPDYKYHFGAPALSSTFAGFGTSGPRYDQIFMVTPDDSLGINPQGILDNVKSSNNINSRTTQQWLNGGMKWKDFYFSLSISDITDINAMYSDKLTQLAIKGNGAFIDETVNLAPIALKALHYREYAMGAAWDLNDNLNFGFKTKLLFGKSAINTEQMDLELTTSKDLYHLDITSKFLVNASLPSYKVDSADVSWSEYMFYGANFGLGFDFGATYKLDDLWSFSASVIDLGYIQYDRFLKTYKSDTQFTYKGIDVAQFEGLDDKQRQDQLDYIKDSLIDLFDINESAEKFIVPLTAKVYLGADYKFSDKETIGALVRLEIFKGVLRPSFTASYYRQLNNNIGVTASYTMINRSYLNLGLGVVANFNPVQVYIATDNIIGVIVPDKVRYGNIHIGINFIFNENKEKHPMINL